jgi:RNA polymerase sigma-70 factor (ECF subfamily)
VVLWNAIAEHKILLADGLLDVPLYDVSPGEMYFASLARYFASPRPGLPYPDARAYGARLAGVIVKHRGESAQAAGILGAPVHVVENGVSPGPLRDPGARTLLVIGTAARIHAAWSRTTVESASRPALRSVTAGEPFRGRRATPRGARMTSSSKLARSDLPARGASACAPAGEESGVRKETRRRSLDDDADLVRALCEGDALAERTLLDRYGAHVDRILTRILGEHPDLDDLALEVFVRAFERIADLREPGALRSWLTGIAVFVAREAIRRKRRRRWLVFLPIEDAADLEVPASIPEARAALRAVYEVIGRLDADVGIAFALRFVEGMELTEIAAACDVSLATVKRRIKRAEAEFSARGRAHEALAGWFEEGTRWPLEEG